MVVNSPLSKGTPDDIWNASAIAKDAIHASNGSWPDDPIFSVSVQTGHSVFTVPVRAISKVVAEHAIQRSIPRYASVIGATRSL